MTMVVLRVRPVFDSAVPRRFGMVALTLYPYILFAKTCKASRTEFDRETLKHEMVHVRQARRYFTPLLFYLLYVFHFIRCFILAALCPGSARGHHRRKRRTQGLWERLLGWLREVYNTAYHANPFEVEAYGREQEELDDEELDELLSVGAINVHCLRVGELRRVCRLCGVDEDEDAGNVFASKRSMLSYLEAYLAETHDREKDRL